MPNPIFSIHWLNNAHVFKHSIDSAKKSLIGIFLSRGLNTLFLLLVLTGVSTTAYTQDSIITISGDTIDCQITQVTKNSIRFIHDLAGTPTNSRIDMANVADWSRSDVSPVVYQAIGETEAYSKIRITAGVGAGYRIASAKAARESLVSQGFSETDARNYYRKLKTGYHTSGQIHFMGWHNLGLGIDYQFTASGSTITGSVDSGDGYTRLYGDLSEDIFINYVGFSAYTEEWLRKGTWKLYSQASMGVTFYRNETMYIISPVLFTGKTFGINTQAGLKYMLRPNLALFAGADYFQARITKVTVENNQGSQEVELEAEQQEGLGRLGLSFGVTFQF